ncbi:hypothetical protein G6F60_014731 [Rhizopus arrhizus]|nr:hypothetical protein G6F60_014731 [Rhizopus arrhizus]
MMSLIWPTSLRASACEEDHRQDRAATGGQHGFTCGVDLGADAGQRIEDIGRHHVQQHLHHAGHFARHVVAGHRQLQATGAGLQHGTYTQAHAHRQRGGDHEPQEGAATERGNRLLAVQ